MNFKLKTLAVAVVLAACAGQASAAIQPGNLASGAAGSELLFYAYDDVAKTSYVLDLGITFASLISNPTQSYSLNISGDANWLSYLGSVTDTSNTFWGIVSSEKTSALGANGINILTTARSNAPATSSSSQVKGIDGTMNTTYLGALNAVAGNTNYAVNDSYFQTSATNNANFAAGMGINHNYNGKVGFLADNAIGYTANFYRLSAAASATTAATLTTLATQWKFDGTSIGTVAAVPEPETYSMLFAGLMMLGAIARRRKI